MSVGLWVGLCPMAELVYQPCGSPAEFEERFLRLAADCPAPDIVALHDAVAANLPPCDGAAFGAELLDLLSACTEADLAAVHAALESSFAQLAPDEASWKWGAKAFAHVRSCPGCVSGRCLLGLSRAEPALLDDCMAAVRLAAEVAEDEARVRALVPAAAGRDSVYNYDATSTTQSRLAAALHAEQAEAAADAAPSRDEVHASIVTKLTVKGCSVAAALSFVGRSRNFWYHLSKQGGGGSLRWARGVCAVGSRFRVWRGLRPVLSMALGGSASPGHRGTVCNGPCFKYARPRARRARLWLIALGRHTQCRRMVRSERTAHTDPTRALRATLHRERRYTRTYGHGVSRQTEW